MIPIPSLLHYGNPPAISGSDHSRKSAGKHTSGARPCRRSAKRPTLTVRYCTPTQKLLADLSYSQYFQSVLRSEFQNRDAMTGIFPEVVIQEADQILKILSSTLPKKVDGKAAILELKEADYQWRQMEWIGWYFEYKLCTILTHKIGGHKGPAFGNTTFDYQKNCVWDFKAHPCKNPKGKINEPMILNDREALDLCIQQYLGIGFIVVHGEAVFDSSGEFKAWHDELKGGHSVYEKERIQRRAPSRKRKCAFEIDQIEAIFFNTPSELKKGVDEKWITFFQEGMRNADGSPRRPKYTLWTTRTPESIRPVELVRLKE